MSVCLCVFVCVSVQSLCLGLSIRVCARLFVCLSECIYVPRMSVCLCMFVCVRVYDFCAYLCVFV